MALYRAQILLEESQHDHLAILARESGRSMSELIREIVAEHLTNLSEDEAVRQSLAAVEELSQLRGTIADEHGQLPAHLLDDLRSERDEEIAR